MEFNYRRVDRKLRTQEAIGGIMGTHEVRDEEASRAIFSNALLAEAAKGG